MKVQDDLSEENTGLFLPILIPTAAVLLQRTNKQVSLLFNVIQESSADYWYERGKKSNTASEWAEAGYSFEQCIKLNAAHWRGNLQLAVSLASLQQIEAAETAFKNAYEQRRYDKNLHYSRDSKQAFGNELPITHWRIIEHELNSLKLIKPQSFENLIALSILYDSSPLENWKLHYQTLDLMELLFSKQTMNSITWQYFSGIRSYSTKNWSNALINFNQIIALIPDAINAYSNRAHIKYNLKDFIGSLSDYNHAIQFDPRIAVNYFRRGIVRHDLEDYDGALEDFNHFISLEPQSRSAHSNRMVIQSRLTGSNPDWAYRPLLHLP